MGAVVQTFVFDSECSEQLKVDLIGGEAPVTVHLAKQAHKPIYIAFDSGSDKPKDSSKKPEEILMSRKLRGARRINECKGISVQCGAPQHQYDQRSS